MRRHTVLLACVVVVLIAGVFVWRTGSEVVAAQGAAPDVQIDRVSIGGVVLNSGTQAAEAGVWVIAQTNSLPTPFRKIVVTDDQGRFVIPDLPAASYELWVRGYGLKDSAVLKASRGQRVKLQVATASSPQEAARIYPASYWLSLYEPPTKEELPAGFTSQDHWIAAWKNGCNHCHQLGMIATRARVRAEDWDAALSRANSMSGEADRLGRAALTKSLAAWGSRIRAGELPPVPPRPAGLERNIVMTQWDWGYDDSFVHDLTSTDKRNPAFNPYGKVYGLDMGRETLWALNPTDNTVTPYHVPVRNPKGYNGKIDYYHDRMTEEDWMANPHNPMMDDKGRIWITTQIRPEDPESYPKWARNVIGTEHNTKDEIDAAYKLIVQSRHHHQLGFLDPKTGAFVFADTAYSNHHLQFDRDGKIWSNAPGDPIALGMFDTTKFDPKNAEGTEAGAQKAWMHLDPKTLNAVPGSGYAVAVSPVDGTIWQSSPNSGGPSNKLYKFDPQTRKFTDYPLTLPGRLPHGIDASTDGKLWFSTGSGHLGRFDPTTEKFTYWELPVPKLKGTGKETGTAEFPYFLWVDQFDVFGLGKDTVIVTGTVSDSLQVFDPKKETFSVIRIPYPMPFYTRGLDGRIDDAKAGWKGRGIWATYSSYLPRFTETQMGSVAHIQLRPSPVAY